MTHVTAADIPADPTRATQVLNSEPEWFRTAVFYEVLVRSFRDSNGDGVGDFQGLIEKLDYLASTACGSPRSSPRLCVTAGTTSPTTPTSFPSAALWRTSTSSSTPATSAASG